jgi:hypothetical protein
MTAKEIYDRYNVQISPQKLGALRAAQRRAEGLPFHDDRVSRPVLTEEEEAAALAQAEHDDIMGNFGFDPEDYTTLRAQNAEDAKREAEERWRRRPHDDAIGYDIWRANWSCAHSVRVRPS